MRGGHTALLIGALVAGVYACTSAPVPTAPPTQIATPIPTQAPLPTPAPTILAFPELSQLALTPGLYDSSPPFAVEFTFVIPNEGWESAHIHDDFFDVMRLDGPDPVVPTRWVAFGFPLNVHGPDGSQPAASLTPEEALDLMANVPGVEASAASPLTFAGREGLQVDLHAELPGTKLFGGNDGDFALDPTFDMRLGAIERDPGLFLVMCFGPPGELDAGCADSQPIIDSVELR